MQIQLPYRPASQLPDNSRVAYSKTMAAYHQQVHIAVTVNSPQIRSDGYDADEDDPVRREENDSSYFRYTVR